MPATRLLQPLPPRVDWSTFQTLFDWQQGEHVAIICPTGGGKSTLVKAICWRRDWVVNLCTKKIDDTYDQYLAQGYKRLTKTWPPPKQKTPYGYFLFWPEYKTLADTVSKPAPLFSKLFNQVFIDGGWTVGLDDLYWLSEKLKLRNEITAINYQVRSLGVSLVAAMQRPKKVPLESWDQATHVFLSGVSNYDDLMQIRAVAGDVDLKSLLAWMQQLKPFEWLYIPVRKQTTSQIMIVKPPQQKVKTK